MLLLRKVSDLLDDSEMEGSAKSRGMVDSGTPHSTASTAVKSGNLGAVGEQPVCRSTEVTVPTDVGIQEAQLPQTDVDEGIRCSNRAGSDWEMVAGGMCGKKTATDWTARSQSVSKDVQAAARALRLAASAAEALAPHLPQLLRRAEEAEMEVSRLETALREAEAKIDALQAQQLRLTDGFTGEIAARDAELAALRAQIAAVTKASCPVETSTISSSEVAPPRDGTEQSVTTSAASSETIMQDGVGERIEVLTLTGNDPTGIEFDQSNTCLKVVSSVDQQFPAGGCFAIGDEIISVQGTSARNMSWEELDSALAERPVVVSVRRLKHDSQGRSSSTRGLIGTGIRSLAGWTFSAAGAAAGVATGAAGAAVRVLEAGIADLDELAEPATATPNDCEHDPAPDAEDRKEARNRPFYELVRSSMAASAREANCLPGDNSPSFERWLRNFHSERDDDWFANNHTRVYNAFRPHWDEVVAAQRHMSQI